MCIRDRYDQGIERIPDTRLSDLRAIERTYSMPECASLEEWEARAAWLRDHVRASTGLLPWPGQRPPVEAHVFDRYVGAVSYTHLDVYKRQAIDEVDLALVLDTVGVYRLCLLYTSRCV